MGSLQIVRFTAAEENVATVEDHVHAVFEGVAAATPRGIQYLAARADNRFLLLLHLADPSTNPLFGIEAATEFRQKLPGWTSDNPAPTTLTVLGDYGMLRMVQAETE